MRVSCKAALAPRNLPSSPPRRWARGGVRGCVPGTGALTPGHPARGAPGTSGGGGGSKPRGGLRVPPRSQRRSLHPLRSGRPLPVLPCHTGFTLPSSMGPDSWRFSGNQRRKVTFTSMCARPVAYGARHTRSPLKFSAWERGQSKHMRTQSSSAGGAFVLFHMHRLEARGCVRLAIVALLRSLPRPFCSKLPAGRSAASQARDTQSRQEITLPPRTFRSVERPTRKARPGKYSQDANTYGI